MVFDEAASSVFYMPELATENSSQDSRHSQTEPTQQNIAKDPQWTLLLSADGMQVALNSQHICAALKSF